MMSARSTGLMPRKNDKQTDQNLLGINIPNQETPVSTEQTQTGMLISSTPVYVEKCTTHSGKQGTLISSTPVVVEKSNTPSGTELNLQSVQTPTEGTSELHINENIKKTCSETKSFRLALSRKQRKKQNQLLRTADKRSSDATIQVGGTPTNKRVNSEGNTPPQDPRPLKKANVGDGKTFAEVVSNPATELAIIDKANPRLIITNEGHQLLRASLTTALDKVIMNINSEIPRFSKFILTRGHLLVTCDNTCAITWLREIVPKLVVWEGAQLCVVDKQQLPKPVKAMVWIPGLPEEAPVVLERLGKYNPTLTVQHWRIWNKSVKEIPVGQTITLGLDEQAVQELMELNNAPYYGMEKVKFTIFNKTGDQPDEVGTNLMDTA